jgi:hypothetical protein
MKRIPIPKSEVLAALKEKLPEAVVEDDKDWLWIVEPPLGPIHNVKGGCTCPECKTRAEKRAIVKSINFIFGFKDHVLPSGKVSRWGCSCMAPRPFHHTKSKPKTGSKPIVPAIEQDEDKELAEAAAFFNNE